jgi:hypothetical protein
MFEMKRTKMLKRKQGRECQEQHQICLAVGLEGLEMDVLSEKLTQNNHDFIGSVGVSSF